MIKENRYWNLLELANFKGEITTELVQKKYEEQLQKLNQEEERIYRKHGEDPDRMERYLKGISSFKFGLTNAYQYCIDEASIAIRNRIKNLSEKPNAIVTKNHVQEESAVITGIRKDIREIGYLKNPSIVKKLKAENMNFDLVVPPEQPEEKMYYDLLTGEITPTRKNETSIWLANRKNRVTDGPFSIQKTAIYNIRGKVIKVRDTQLTEYEVKRRKANSITGESTVLYGEIDFDKFEKDLEYRASFYKIFERARIEQNPYIGTLMDNKHIMEDSLEKNIARKLRKMELGEYDKSESKDSEKSQNAGCIGVDR